MRRSGVREIFAVQQPIEEVPMNRSAHIKTPADRH
jgi:hypothetical protein